MRRPPRLLRISRIATAAMLLLIPAAAHATPITYEFSGTTTSTDGLNGGANVPGGTPFSGSFTYDSNLPVTDPSAHTAGTIDPSQHGYDYIHAVYTGPADALAAKINFGGLMSYDTTNASVRTVVISNDPTFPPSSFSVNAMSTDGQWISIHLGDPTGQALTGTNLPTTLDLAKFGESSATYYDPNLGLVGGTITSLEAVPEPSTLAVLALGGLGLVISRKTRGPEIT